MVLWVKLRSILDVRDVCLHLSFSSSHTRPIGDGPTQVDGASLDHMGGDRRTRELPAAWSMGSVWKLALEVTRAIEDWVCLADWSMAVYHAWLVRSFPGAAIQGMLPALPGL